MKDTFSSYHPIVNFSFFAMVIVFSMIFMHPVCLGISLVSAFSYSVYLGGKKALKFNLIFMLPMFLVTALINPAFNHEGATILAYIGREGNPLTLESIMYGLAAAVMLVSVICWFSCYNAVMTSDKFIYLFGRVIPALSLILSMALRFVPKFKAQLYVVSNAQKCLGRDVSNGSLFERIKYGITILSVMITWVLENAIETADSMKSRGYGLKGRTAFSIFRFDGRDRAVFAFMLGCSLYILVSSFYGLLKFRYFPTLRGTDISIGSLAAFAVYAALCLTPLAINIWEDMKWTRLQSNI